ncbi:dihydrolipoyllysine-residue acetyltransferase component of pyruvate dehydrogenase complex, mitochondrial-like [Amphibalanus amphitrite]|uniref:dihydrolipoyllysine-residue acetyltransferase component of pyruvate dehydrogenase complex, mitochondrial-like n=1 Tax=Amphibalanus amphitrite TaxID=1232801 RepID=UPI001C920428|nr:dihydrolipoyllysine-residue acetyltransferase component of pyruvate dehydrogenase complex, mitochondrial-like [Amphibalanus amphitrite]
MRPTTAVLLSMAFAVQLRGCLGAAAGPIEIGNNPFNISSDMLVNITTPEDVEVFLNSTVDGGAKSQQLFFNFWRNFLRNFLRPGFRGPAPAPAPTPAPSTPTTGPTTPTTPAPTTTTPPTTPVTVP